MSIEKIKVEDKYREKERERERERNKKNKQMYLTGIITCKTETEVF